MPLASGETGAPSGGDTRPNSIAANTIGEVRRAISRATLGRVNPQGEARVTGPTETPAGIITAPPRADALLSSADQEAANANLAAAAGPPDNRALKRIATGGKDAWGAPEPPTSAAEREMAATKTPAPGGPPAPSEASADPVTTPAPDASVADPAATPEPTATPTPKDEATDIDTDKDIPVGERLTSARSTRDEAKKALAEARARGADSKEIQDLQARYEQAESLYRDTQAESDRTLAAESIGRLSAELTKVLAENKAIMSELQKLQELPAQLRQMQEHLQKAAEIAMKKASDEDKLTLQKIIILLGLALGKQLVGDFTNTVTAPVGKTGR